MSRTYHHGERRIRVKGIRRNPDLRKLARVLIEIARLEAAAEAEKAKQSRPAAKRRASSPEDHKPGSEDAA